MPMLVPAGTTPPTPTPTPPRFDPGGLTAEWIAPDRTVVPLTTPALGWYTLDAVSGIDGLDVDIVTDPAMRGGARIRHQQDPSRTIIWPIRAEDRLHMGLVEMKRYLIRKIRQTRTRGPGILRIYRPDGTAREIEASYQRGLFGEPGQGHTLDTAVLNLLCEDPYWRDIAAQEPIVREYVGSPVDFQDPFPSVSSSQSLDGAFVIDNTGDVEAWPTWVITGPMTSVIATNLTTGDSFTLTGALADSTETVTIDTYSGEVVGPDGVTSWFGNLTLPGAVLWGLVDGENAIEFQVADADTGSQISLTWTRRWESS